MASSAAVFVLLVVAITISMHGGSRASSEVMPPAPGGSASATALLRQQQELELRGLLDVCSDDCTDCLLSSAEACGLDDSYCPNPLSSVSTIRCFVQQIPVLMGCLRGSEMMLPVGAATAPSATALLQQPEKFELPDPTSWAASWTWPCLFRSLSPCVSDALRCPMPLKVVTCVVQKIPSMQECLRDK